MLEVIGSIFVLLGAIVHFSAGLGLVRMPDAYTRLQAVTKATTLGNTLIVLGIACLHPGWIWKLLIIVYFIFMTNPISSHALARAALALGVPMVGGRAASDLSNGARPTSGGDL